MQGLRGFHLFRFLKTAKCLSLFIILYHGETDSLVFVRIYPIFATENNNLPFGGTQGSKL